MQKFGHCAGFARGEDDRVAVGSCVTSSAAVCAPAARVVLGSDTSDTIFDAMEAHKRELERRNQTIEAICAAEDRHKAEERDAWHRYEEASIALLTTEPTSMPA